MIWAIIYFALGAGFVLYAIVHDGGFSEMRHARAWDWFVFIALSAVMVVLWPVLFWALYILPDKP